MKRSVILPIIIVLLLSCIGGGAYVAYEHSSQRNIPLIFSNNQTLLEMWASYKKTFIEQGSNRTVDRSQNNVSTSEGESYTMLRAVWMDDKPTFDQSWVWTQDNLQRPDSLFAWSYGPLPNGHYGVQTSIGGNNTASDGDTDIALALLMAYIRWNNPQYLAEAKPIIQSIWKEEVVNVAGQPVMTADDLERNSQTTVVVNPSYFMPYAYRAFAKVDPKDNWNGLLNNSYSLLATLSSSPLSSSKSAGLFPDWVFINRTTGAITAPPASSGLTTNYGYNAIRIPWQLALDYQWYHDPRDKSLLEKLSFLETQWNQNQKLDAVYAHDGSVVGNYESTAMYGAAMGYFVVVQPQTGKQVYKEKIQTLYNPDKQIEITSLSYYDANWGWFGMALAQDALTNLTVQ